MLDYDAASMYPVRRRKGRVLGGYARSAAYRDGRGRRRAGPTCRGSSLARRSYSRVGNGPLEVPEQERRRPIFWQDQVYRLQVSWLARVFTQVSQQDRPQHGRVGREDVANRPVLPRLRQAHGERHLASGDRRRVLTGRVRMLDPVAYAIRRGPETAEEGVHRDRRGVHGRRGELFGEGLGAAYHLDPLARDVEVRVADGPLLSDVEEVHATVGAQGLCHA